jgi:2-phosphosulfolactate phosphatase
MQVTHGRLLEGAQSAWGVAVIIDVFRAFTCAPLLFSLGIRKLIMAATPEEAFAHRQKNNELVLIGEVDGIPVEGFDLGNSPSEILKKGEAFFKGKTVVQRTSSGVQGVLAALEVADEVLPASYALAKATVRYIQSKNPPRVSLVAMGWAMEYPAPEDEWCASYISHLLGISAYDHNTALAEILFSKETRKFFDPGKPHFPPEDPVMCLQLDVYNFVLQAARDDGDVVLNKIDF